MSISERGRWLQRSLRSRASWGIGNFHRGGRRGGMRALWRSASHGHLSQRLLEKLQPVIWRIQWARALEAMVFLQLVGILLVAGTLLLQLVLPIDLSTSLLVAIALLGGGLVGVGYGWAQRPSLFEAAVLLDRRLGLHERMATLLELSLTHPSSPFLAPLQADALSHAEPREVAKAFPIRIPRRTPWLILSLAGVLAWELTMAGLTIPGTVASQIAQRIREEGKVLEQVAREMERRGRVEVLPETRRLSQKLSELGRKFQKERLERVDALAKIKELTREIEATRIRLEERLKAEELGPRQEPSGDLLRRLGSVSRRIRSIREGIAPFEERGTGKDLRSLLSSLDELQQEENGLPQGLLQTLEEARRKLSEGDWQGAARSLESAEERATALHRLLLDEEGLTQAHSQLQRSAENIARGGGGESPMEARSPHDRGEGKPPRSRSPGLDQGAPGEQEPVPPSLGPYTGTEPGTGRVVEFTGPPTPRLRTPKAPLQLRGIPGEGKSRWTEVAGKGEESRSVRIPRRAIVGAIQEADRYMERARVPAPFREVVRRYFQELARW